MSFLPLVVSLAVGALLAPAFAAALTERGLVRENYRGARVAAPTGPAILLAALVALIPLALLDRLTGVDVLPPALGPVLLYVLGAGLLGLVDDLVGGAAAGGGPGRRFATPRGLRGHASAAARGRLSTGVLKALGSLGLAAFVLAGREGSSLEYGLAIAVLVLATHFFNLLDLRPGRSIKALVLLGAGLTLASLELSPLWALGLLVGPILALLPLDLRERGMLGDAGAGAIGGVAGFWLVLVLSPAGQAVALVFLAGAMLYGEFRSISSLIERTPGLRHLDSLGRSHA